MQRVRVTSSNVAAVGYDLANSILEVEFLDGSVYEYYSVPLHIHESLMSAASVGGFLASSVKGTFHYKRL
jgi:hypothetical protein